MRSGGWRAAPGRLPDSWCERADVFGEAFITARTSALCYISRRRAEPESADVLAETPFENPHPTPQLQARPPPERVEWPVGAPPRPIHITQLYNRGVYAEILSAIDDNIRELDAVEAALARGESSVSSRWLRYGKASETIE